MRRLLHSTAGLALALTVGVSPVLAQTATLTCQDRVILDCAAAMKDANALEKLALGVYCTGLLASCNITSVNVSVKPT